MAAAATECVLPQTAARMSPGSCGSGVQTPFLHLGPGCHSSCTLQHPTLTLPRAIPPLPTFQTFLLIPCPTSGLCSARSAQLAEDNTNWSNNWERELAGRIRSIIKAGASPSCSSGLCCTNTNCLPSGLPCLRAGSWESRAGSFDPNFSAAVRVMAFTVLLTHGESRLAGTIKAPWRAEILFVLTLRPCYALGAL